MGHGSLKNIEYDETLILKNSESVSLIDNAEGCIIVDQYSAASHSLGIDKYDLVAVRSTSI